MGTRALHDTKLLNKSFHLTLNLADPRFRVLVPRRIYFLVSVWIGIIIALGVCISLSSFFFTLFNF